MAGKGVVVAVKDAARVASGLALVLSQPLARERAVESLAAASAALGLPSSAAAAAEAAKSLVASKFGVPGVGRGSKATPPSDALSPSSRSATSRDSHSQSHSSNSHSSSSFISNSNTHSSNSHSYSHGFSSPDVPSGACTVELPSLDSTWKGSVRQADGSTSATIDTSGLSAHDQASSQSHAASSWHPSASTGPKETPVVAADAHGWRPAESASSSSDSSGSALEESPSLSSRDTVPSEAASPEAAAAAAAPVAASSNDGGDIAPGPVAAREAGLAERSRGTGRATRVPATQAGRIMG